MSEETCPDCGLPRRSAPHSYSEGTCAAHRNANGKASCDARTLALLRSQLSAATARASELEAITAKAEHLTWPVAKRDTELAAWRALAEWASSSESNRWSPPYLGQRGWIGFANVREPSQFACEMCGKANADLNETTLHLVGEGETPGAAAVDLATKLGLIAPNGKDTK